jgi:branched-subunit amino acid transport protein AzlD
MFDITCCSIIFQCFIGNVICLTSHAVPSFFSVLLVMSHVWSHMLFHVKHMTLPIKHWKIMNSMWRQTYDITNKTLKNDGAACDVKMFDVTWCPIIFQCFIGNVICLTSHAVPSIFSVLLVMSYVWHHMLFHQTLKNDGTACDVKHMTLPIKHWKMMEQHVMVFYW